MSSHGRWRLSVMMALVYAVQGAFWPVLAVHLHDLGISGRERGWIFSTLAMGSFLMPLGAGQLVDRLMATQNLLALIFALGSGILMALASGLVTTPLWLFLVFLGYWLLSAPAYALSTSLALRHLAHPEREYGGVRLWGTVGWMASGWLVSGVMTWSGTTRAGQGAFEAFGVAALISMFVALYCLSLPETPPLAVGGRAGGGPRDALQMIGRRDVGVFLLTALGVSITTPFVYQVMPSYLESSGLPRRWVSSAMTLGQWPEIATLALMPWLLQRIGYRATLVLGIGAWALRFGSLAANPPLWVAVAGIALHGVGVGCFSVCGQMFIDRCAQNHLRASAQALLVVLTSGVGSMLGSLLAGEVGGRFQFEPLGVFLVPCVINVALLTYFCSGFRSEAATVAWDGEAAAARSLRSPAVRGPVARVSNLVAESADG